VGCRSIAVCSSVLGAYCYMCVSLGCLDSRKARRCKKWNLREKDDCDTEDHFTEPLLWTLKQRIEYPRVKAMICILLGTALCWFLLNTTFLVLEYNVLRVIDLARRSTIVAKTSPGSHSSNRVIPLEFGNVLFRSILPISLKLVVSIMLLSRVFLKLKAGLTFYTLVILIDCLNFPLSDLSLLVLIISGILVFGVLVLRGSRRPTNRLKRFLAFIH
jgi:hypothetical protein